MNTIIQTAIDNPEELTTEELAELLRNASDAYYNTSNTILTDEQFDLLKDTLQERDPKHPALKQVGAPVQGNKVKLPYWMGSLDKIRDDDKTLSKWQNKYYGNVVISDKLDGNSAMFYNEKGEDKLFSRGDGTMGQDISHLIPLIKGLPKNLKEKVAIRGELIISKKNWKSISDVGANARNVVAGVMHNKTPTTRITDKVEFIAYEMLHERLKISDQIKYMKSLGFKTVYELSTTSEELDAEFLTDILMERRELSDYELDGIVVMHDEDHKQVKGSNPKYAFAYKSLSTHEEAEAVVKEVEWNVRRYAIFPTVLIEPISLEGTTIQRVTGVNAAFIEKNKIGKGSRIIIIRSGAVIPKIQRVLIPSKKPDFPTNMKYEWDKTHVHIVLVQDENDAPNESIEIEKMVKFAESLEMAHIGPGTIQRLYAGGINSIPKLLAVKLEQLQRIDGYQGTMADKIYKSISDTKARANCIDYMVASNIFGQNLGRGRIVVIAEAFPKILELQTITFDELRSIKGVGKVIADAFIAGYPKFINFAKEIGYDCVKQTKALVIEQPVTRVKINPKVAKLFTNQIVVFTGFTNAELEATIVSVGGKVANSFTNSVTMVIAKDTTKLTGKLTKAMEKGIPILSMEEALNMILI